MGRTLTHGVYLPNEGERNCYNGLASNWRLLDGAIGTVAAHTTAIAGKADISHTHGNITNDGKVGTTANVPLITGTGGAVQAGSFGTSANTFCEGNDSRLSDARTPVAHTHGKADVTDLFNSANTWTGNNTYSKTVAIERSTDTGNFLALKNTVAELGSTPASATPVTIAYRDKNDESLGYMGVYYDTDGSNHFRLYVRNKFTSGSPSTSGSADYAYFGLKLNADKSREGILKASFRPYDNNTYDLGSSSYQWNNLYAKNYFYNGTAWGLDQANVWNTYQTIKGSSTGDEYGGNAKTNLWLMSVRDTEEVSGILFDSYRQNTAQGTGIHILGIGIKENRVRYEGCRFGWYWDNNLNGYSFDFKPTTQGANQALKHNLGTSVDKWDTLNGINPGALSLPNVRAAVADPVDTVNWNLTGSRNTYTPTEDGWFFIRVAAGADGCSVNVHAGSSSNDYPTWTNSSAGGDTTLVVPAEKGITLYVYVKATSISYCSFRPCLGNV